MVALEELKALRYRDLLRKKARVILQKKNILPASVVAGRAEYPRDIEAVLRSGGYRVSAVGGDEVLARFGSARVANVFLLGMLSRYLEFEPALWKKTLQRLVKEEFREINWKVFRAGRGSE